MGRLQQKEEEQGIQASQNEKALQKRLREEKQVPQRLYGSLDAAKVRIEPRARQGEPVPEHEDWRDMKVGCWYQAEAVALSRQSSRQRRKSPTRGHGVSHHSAQLLL